VNLLERAHERFVYPRRIERLSSLVARLVPADALVLDVGSGDGALGAAVARERPDVSVTGVDVLVRPETAIPTTRFDGRHLDHERDSFDAALLMDVLHHADAPMQLLAETARVAQMVIVKDHLLEGALAGATLRLMDRTGNAPHGVALPYRYWTRPQWQQAFAKVQLEPTVWIERLGIYPWPAGLLFDRSLHFVAMLERSAWNARAESQPVRQRPVVKRITEHNGQVSA
jgi:SAM-dependent methyltransferase